MWDCKVQRAVFRFATPEHMSRTTIFASIRPGGYSRRRGRHTVVEPFHRRVYFKSHAQGPGPGLCFDPNRTSEPASKRNSKSPNSRTHNQHGGRTIRPPYKDAVVRLPLVPPSAKLSIDKGRESVFFRRFREACGARRPARRREKETRRNTMSPLSLQHGGIRRRQ